MVATGLASALMVLATAPSVGVDQTAQKKSVPTGAQDGALAPRASAHATTGGLVMTAPPVCAPISAPTTATASTVLLASARRVGTEMIVPNASVCMIARAEDSATMAPAAVPVAGPDRKSVV